MTSRRSMGGSVAVLGLIAVAGLSTSAAAQAAPRQADRPVSSVPENLVPPAGNTEVARYRAKGVQIYQCASGKWAFVEPVAVLKRPYAQAIHFRGPSWQSVNDGSLVEAKAVANSPVEGSIPELLLQATATRGEGIFGSVTYVQRLKTRGGAAPTTSCTDGETESVRYKADYRFFAKSS